MRVSEITAAKICFPKTSNLYLRPRLFDLLEQYRGRGIIWITGAAGSGKTSLVSSYLSYKQIYTLWYQLDEGDADLPTFFYYLGQAGKKAPRRRRRPLPMLTPEYLAGLGAFSKLYFENLSGKLPSPAALVFDNYHELPAEARLHEVIRIGLSSLPPELSVIIISRESPPPFVASFIATGRFHVIGQEELNLSPEEAAGVLKSYPDREISPAAVEQMNQLVQGWVAGLILLAQSSGSDSLRPDLTCRPSGNLFNYFAAEVFEKTDKKTQEFLWPPPSCPA